MGWRQNLQRFRDLFLTKEKRRKRRDSEANSTTQKEEKKTEYSTMKRSLKKEKITMVMTPNETDPEGEQMGHPNHSSLDTDPDEEVLQRQASLPSRSRKPTIRMRTIASQLSASGHRASTRSLPMKTQHCSASDTEIVSQINNDSSLQASPTVSVFGSMSLVKEPPAVPSPPPAVGKISRLFFHSDSHDDEDKHPRQGCRSRANSKSRIKVKYTKVYGEQDGAYRNDSVPRGLIFMCNFSKFKDNKHSERIGSEQDYENLLDLFHQMGYGQRNRKEKFCRTGYITKEEFMNRLRTFSHEGKHQMSCSCIIIIMSHGSGPKTFLTSDNQEVDLMDVYSIFDNINCMLLKGKPKIFILQFCRNQATNRHLENTYPNEINWRKIMREEIEKYMQTHQQDSGLAFQNVQDEENPRSPVHLVIKEMSRKTSTTSFSSQTMELSQCPGPEMQQLETSYPFDVDGRHLQPQLPHEGLQRYSDMYSIFSTASGELSHRDKRKGSLLIQAICHIFAENAYHDDIETLVRKVSTYMTRTLQRDDPIHVPRQTCERTNNGLDKTFYFNPHENSYSRHKTI
ncbi:hypothetical protein Pcinc_042734 [Petrolisthes cinctipes]|uniref:Uncharacterized protein n=1 Tax=Petrolisthes cinctipes TaxID=88211 RepID=A0AAE1EFQ9_PETCI|nr:hypothetical protein Pcinc_042734 [Petrolisthes cinctipes]